MGLEGLGKEDLKRVLDIRAAIGDVTSQISKGNAELKKMNFSFANMRSEIGKIETASTKFAQLQDEAAKSAKATTEAIKKEAEQLSIVRTLNLEINSLANKAIGTSEKQATALLNQARRLSSARDSAQGLADEFGKLAKSSSQLDSNTMWFTGFSEFLKDIPGLRALSGPFQDAAQASRETLINNAKVGEEQSQIKEQYKSIGDIQKLDGRTLTKEKLKSLKLDNITGGLEKTAARDKLVATMKANKNASGGVAGLKAGFKGLKGIISKAFVPLLIIQTVVSAVKMLLSLMSKASKQTAKFSNELLIGREAANELRRSTHDTVIEFNLASKAAGGVAITQEGLLKTMGAINQKLGFQVNILKDFGSEMGQNVAEATMMSEKFGLSADASARLFLESVKTGKPLKEMTKEYFGQAGLLSSQEGLTADVIGNLEAATKVSGNLRANFKGNSFAIAEGVFNAKRLGFELSQMEGVSSSLLSFQSSIENEMAAELLTGKQLNLSKAREYALMGDTENLMKEISRQAGTQEEFLSMNIIQRQALAKAVGMEVNELADMYDKKSKNDALAKKNLEVVNKLKLAGLRIDDENFNLEKASLQEIRIASQAAGQSEEELRKTLGEQIYLRKSEQSATEKFNEALSRAKDIFASFVGGGSLDALADGLSNVTESAFFRFFIGKAGREKLDAAKKEKNLERINEERKGRGLAAIDSDDEGAYKKAMRAEKMQARYVETNKYRKEKGLAPLVNRSRERENEFGEKLVVPIDNAEELNDFIIRPGQRPIKYNKGDLLMGGTNLGGGNNSNIEALLSGILSAIENGGDVYMDGNKVGKSLALASSKMG